MGLFNWKKKKKKEQKIDDESKIIIDEFTQEMSDKAEACVSKFDDRFKGLDFTENSLKIIDDILEEVSDFYEEMPELQQKSIIDSIGSYIFEVARRNYGGKYFWYDQRNQPILVTGKPNFEISIIVFDKVEGRILNGEEDNIPYFFKGYSERVKNAKDGDNTTIV